MCHYFWFNSSFVVNFKLIFLFILFFYLQRLFYKIFVFIARFLNDQISRTLFPNKSKTLFLYSFFLLHRLPRTKDLNIIYVTNFSDISAFKLIRKFKQQSVLLFIALLSACCMQLFVFYDLECRFLLVLLKKMCCCCCEMKILFLTVRCVVNMRNVPYIYHVHTRTHTQKQSDFQTLIILVGELVTQPCANDHRLHS